MESKTERFTFDSVPESAGRLLALPEGKLDTPYKTAALAILALMKFSENEALCFAMLDALRGPDPMTEYTKQFIRDRLKGRQYKAGSFFAGATAQNGYTPTLPLTIEISSGPYSFTEENWATMFIKSAGADSPRQIKLRKKPSTGQWFVNEIQCLSDIREPAAADDWA